MSPRRDAKTAEIAATALANRGQRLVAPAITPPTTRRHVAQRIITILDTSKKD